MPCLQCFRSPRLQLESELEYRNSTTVYGAPVAFFNERVTYIQGGYENAFLKVSWSENPELLPGFEPGNPWIQGLDDSQYAMEKFYCCCHNISVLLSLLTSDQPQHTFIVHRSPFTVHRSIGCQLLWLEFEKSIMPGNPKGRVQVALGEPRLRRFCWQRRILPGRRLLLPGGRDHVARPKATTGKQSNRVLSLLS